MSLSGCFAPYSVAACGRRALVVLALITMMLAAAVASAQEGFPQDNVNTAGPTPAGWLDAGNPLKQMNEPDCTVSPGRPNVVICGANDYSGVDPGSLDTPDTSPALRSVGDSWLGMMFSRDFGRRWIRGIHPCHSADSSCSIGLDYMADPNCSAFPGLLVCSGIAGTRDNSQPGGIFASTWSENNAPTGPPYTFLRIDQLVQGTDAGGGGRFIDKPAQDESIAPPGTPPVLIQIPDPNNPGSTTPVSIPAGAVHLAYAVFVGNDNNLGTKINYEVYQNYDLSAPAFKTKITEGTDVNQGAYIASRDYGRDNLIVWRRVRNNNEETSIMFVTCGTNKCTKPKVLANFCPHDQSTGRARPRELSLPVATHTGVNGDWYVFYADRGDGNKTCLDADSNDVMNESGVPSRLDYSRIMMATWDGKGKANWNIQPVDPQLADPTGPASKKNKGHQIWPAVAALNGTVQVTWTDSRDSRLYSVIANSPLVGFFDNPALFGIDRFIEDYVLSTEGLLPARAYKAAEDAGSPLPTGTPFRQSVDTWGTQIMNGVPGQSVKVSRYPFGISPFTGTVTKLMHSFSGPRIFRQGTRSFHGDYATVGAVPFRLKQVDEWEEAEGIPTPSTIAPPTVFYSGFTDNRLIRGNVYYDGCNESTGDCSNDYEMPYQNTPPPEAMIPLQGEEDPSQPPLACTPGNPKALSRNQKVFVAAIKPGLALSVVSARKPENSAQDRTFVLYVQNSSNDATTVTLSVPSGAPARWNRDTADPLNPVKTIEVFIPRRAGAVRTLFVDRDPDGIIVTASELAPGGQVLQALVNANVDIPLANFEGVVNQEVYDLRFLGDRVVSSNFQDLENQDLENTVFLQDLENQTLLQDLENASILQDLENQDLENLLYEAQDLENTVFAQQDLENRALLFQDLENQDLENTGYEFQDLENRSILFQDLENQDLENQDLENAPYVEVSWPVDSESNTAVGINAKVIAAAGTTEGLTTQVFVTQSYLTHTVSQNPDGVATGQFCTPQVVADNQVLYNEINPVLDPITADPGLTPDVISFFAEPGVPTTITVRIYGDANFDPSNLGLAVYAQAGDVPECSPELDPGNPEFPGCEIDFDPDTTAPILGGVPSDPPAGSPFVLEPDETTFTWDWGPLTATDEDPNVIVQCPPGVPVLGAPDFTFTYPFPLDDTTVNCSATDSSGNSITESFTVTIVDTSAPVITTPPDILDAEATGLLTPVDIGDATATDNFPPVTISNNAPAAGFPIGTTTVTWTATDDNGNTSTASQSITVIDTPPSFSVVASCTLRTEGTSVIVGDWATECPESFSATDLVDGNNVIIDCDADELAFGVHTVSCTATDTRDNESDPELLSVTVEYAYLVEIDRIKRNIQAGSTVPIDFRYLDRESPPQPIDSSGMMPSISWKGPFTGANCTESDTGAGSGEDSGFSDYRLTGTTWQFSWQTPDVEPSYSNSFYLTIRPPGTAESSICVTLK